MKQIGNAQLYHGDSREVLKGFEENSIDCCITDPPYELTSITKRFGKPGSAPCQELKDRYGNGPYVRTSKGFMNQQWDSGGIQRDPEFWRLVYDALKPGGHVLAFGGTRTAHRMACALEDAGFELRDSILCPGLIGYCYGSGFPKSTSVSKQLDKMAGAKGEVVGRGKTGSDGICREAGTRPSAGKLAGEYDITAPATDEARTWAGWGSALKPAWEVIYLCRKPLSESSIAANVLRWSTGALNIDACRIPSGGDNLNGGAYVGTGERNSLFGLGNSGRDEVSPAGRFPSNLLLVHSPTCTDTDCVESCPVRELGRQSGVSSGVRPDDVIHRINTSSIFFGDNTHTTSSRVMDEGTAARFFMQFRYADVDDLPPLIYVPKASRGERERGCEGMETATQQSVSMPKRKCLTCGCWIRSDAIAGGNRPNSTCFCEEPAPSDDACFRENARANVHPTVKPWTLMAYLCRLACPPGGIVLDPFMGSGSTLVAAQREGFRSVGIERETAYFEIACKRVADSANLCGLFAEDP